MDTTDKQKKKSPQKPKAVNTAWVSLITVISFALSVVMSYISNEALASAGTILSLDVYKRQGERRSGEHAQGAQ